MRKFEPKQFEKRSGQAQVETELRKYLRAAPIEEKIKFIKELWPLNYRFALSLTRSSQIPNKQLSEMLHEWLALNQHNCVAGLIKEFEPLIGKEKFWKIATSLELTNQMQEFLNYHSKGEFQRYING